MSFIGYFLLDGTELVNTSRTAVYGAGADWLAVKDVCENLDVGLDEMYNGPLQDDAPWVDRNDPDSWRFWGILPLDVTGLEDSTFTTTFVELPGGGSVPVQARSSARSVVFDVVLVGMDDAALDAGMRWLHLALESGCQGVGGGQLCFLAAAPEIDVTAADPTACLSDYWRTAHRVGVASPPQITRKYNMGDEGNAAMWGVTFTLTAGSPYLYQDEVPVQANLFEAVLSHEAGTSGPLSWTDSPCGATGNISVTQAQNNLTTAKNTLNLAYQQQLQIPTSTVFQEQYQQALNAVAEATDVLAAAKLAASALTDPLAPVMPLPPTPAAVPTDIVVPVFWRRWAQEIPAEIVPDMTDAVAQVSITVGSRDIRMLRVRFYEDPVGLFQPQSLDPCGFCGEFLVSFMPAGGTLVVDGATETVRLTMPGGLTIDARRNIYASDGGPFSWPVITCGIGYIMTVDVGGGSLPPAGVALSIVPRG